MTLAVAQPGLDLLPVLGPQAPGHPQLATRRKTLQCVWGGDADPAISFFFLLLFICAYKRPSNFCTATPSPLGRPADSQFPPGEVGRTCVSGWLLIERDRHFPAGPQGLGIPVCVRIQGCGAVWVWRGRQQTTSLRSAGLSRPFPASLRHGLSASTQSPPRAWGPWGPWGPWACWGGGEAAGWLGR
jgi:hypothetical protein